MPMTKEEFLEGLHEAIQDMADPQGEYAMIVNEGQEIAGEIRQFDPVLADKFMAITAAIEDFGSYVRSRGEFLGGNNTGS